MNRLFFYQATTVFLSLILLFVPVPEFLIWFKPDWVLINIIVWSIFFEGSISFGLIYLLGLFVDVSSGITLGMHAFGYILIVFLGLFLKTRMSLFTAMQRLFFVIILIACYQVILSLCLAIIGKQTIIFYWGPVISAVVAWPLWGAQLQKIGKSLCYE